MDLFAVTGRILSSGSDGSVSAGGEITSTFDHPEMVKLGHCKLIEEVMIGEDMLIRFSGVAMGTNIQILFRKETISLSGEKKTFDWRK